ncbi:MAG TPA: hypothetical protein VN619_11740 [Lacisediminihabitans sp.]|jgi:hypothetical protein|nr:hypothetical protein [Lacisediminihabitans sp.]HXD62583.1 hypothetical protein [Lacisediminihabitans sp.]
MKRIQVIYDGLQYSIGETDYDALKAAIEDAASTGRPSWITVNQGEGQPRPAEILVGPATSIALIAVPDEE